MTLPSVLFEFASAGLPFVVSETAVTRMVGDRFLARDPAKAAKKLELMKDESHYAALVAEVAALKDSLRAKSREGLEKLHLTTK
jgi:hypothetical protein